MTGCATISTMLPARKHDLTRVEAFSDVPSAFALTLERQFSSDAALPRV
jgi:hypothetical protein